MRVGCCISGLNTEVEGQLLLSSFVTLSALSATCAFLIFVNLRLDFIDPLKAAARRPLHEIVLLKE